MRQIDILQTILKDSNYHLALFSEDEIEAIRRKIGNKIIRGKETPIIIVLYGIRIFIKTRRNCSPTLCVKTHQSIRLFKKSVGF